MIFNGFALINLLGFPENFSPFATWNLMYVISKQKDGTCLGPQLVCNFVPDCPSGVDEANCPTTNTFEVKRKSFCILFLYNTLSSHIEIIDRIARIWKAAFGQMASTTQFSGAERLETQVMMGRAWQWQ